MFDDYFKSLQRSAIIITPQQPFFDWLVMHDPETVITDEMKEGEVYLLPGYETRQQMESWLKKNFDELFAEQLNNWYVDETMWPQKRTFKMFCDWFDYSLHPIIVDTQKGWIEKT